MIKKKYLMIRSIAIASVLLGSLFVSSVLVAQSGGEYDPWIDTNDDGIIDINDVATMGSMYGSSGEPINKTALLLELQERIDSLNASLQTDYYNKTESDGSFAPSNHPHDASNITGSDLTLVASSPTFAGSYDTPGIAWDVYVSGKYAYVADHNLGLQIIDISNSSSPTLAGSYNTPDATVGVYVSGKYSYMADQSSGLQIIDVSNPSSPTLAGSYDTPGIAWDVYVSGKYAYVADHNLGLQIIDVSNPSSPTLAGSCDTPGDAWGVYVSGKYAYVADRNLGLQIIDVSNPSSPTLAGSCDTPGYAQGVYVSGKYAYVADEFPALGLRIIDVSNPSSPTLAGSYNTPASAHDVYISGKYAYVASGSAGLQIIDVSNPSSPTLAGSYDTHPGVAYGVYVSGKYAYVANYNQGLWILEVSGIDTPTVSTGNVETGSITVTENADVGNNLIVHNGLNVGPGGLYVDAGNGISTDGDLIALGRVGIGTTSPSSKLDVIGTIRSGQSNGIQFTCPNDWFTISDAGGYSNLAWFNYYNGTNWVASHAIVRPSKIYGDDAGIHFQTSETIGAGTVISDFSDKLTILNGGNVGIGTTNPSERLEVEGNVTAWGWITGDITFQKDGEKLWRMYEEEDGLYLESLKTGKVYSFVLQEVDGGGLLKLNSTHLNITGSVVGLVIASGLMFGLVRYRAKKGKEKIDVQQSRLSQWQ